MLIYGILDPVHEQSSRNSKLVPYQNFKIDCKIVSDSLRNEDGGRSCSCSSCSVALYECLQQWLLL